MQENTFHRSYEVGVHFEPLDIGLECAHEIVVWYCVQDFIQGVKLLQSEYETALRGDKWYSSDLASRMERRAWDGINPCLETEGLEEDGGPLHTHVVEEAEVFRAVTNHRGERRNIQDRDFVRWRTKVL
jgi:hypothetical protein